MNRQMYYYKDGTPINFGDDLGSLATVWGRLHADPNYMRVAETTLPDGTWISTVWLGLDHAFMGPPLIFETMVFAAEEGFGNDLDQDRYSTLVEAEAGHLAMVAKWSKGEGYA